jgi:5'-methylthioadenosine nucleosidase
VLYHPLIPFLLPAVTTAQGAAIGDVFVSTGKMHHDRRIPLPGFDKQGLGYVESTPTPQLQAALQLKAGIVTSGNSLDYTGAQMYYRVSVNSNRVA